MLNLNDSPGTTFSLSRFVEHVQTITPVDGQVSRFEWLPDGRTALVFRVFRGNPRGDVAILGPHTQALFKRPRDIARGVVLAFKPGWSASLLGVAASKLTNRVVMLEELWGRAGGELSVDLIEARNPSEELDRICRALAQRAQQTSESSAARIARRAARLLDVEQVNVDTVAQQLGITARHLRRAFTESIGIGPKRFAMGARLRRALRLAASSQNWASIAAGAGYYDQAHLIADFRELTGVTPDAFLKQRTGAAA